MAYCLLPHSLKVNWNAKTSWPLSQDFEALKTVSKEFLRNSFLFSRYGPLKSSFFTDSEGFRERTGKFAFDTASHKQRSRDVRDDLWVPSPVRFINDSELCFVPVDRWNSSNLTWIWLHWTRTVPKRMSWMINRHICYECGAKWCMFELTNATMMDLTQTSTNIPQMIIPRWITKTK